MGGLLPFDGHCQQVVARFSTCLSFNEFEEWNPLLGLLIDHDPHKLTVELLAAVHVHLVMLIRRGISVHLGQLLRGVVLSNFAGCLGRCLRCRSVNCLR